MGEILYKYCDENGVKILENLQIKVARPNEFNDPFEVSPRFVDDFDEHTAARFLSDPATVEQTLLRMEAKGASQQTKDNFRILTAAHADGTRRAFIASKFASLLSEMAKQNVFEMQEYWSKDIGILCLARIPDSVLMWSHYTNKYQGFVVAFDRSQFPMPERFFDVQYERERFAVSASSYLRDATDEETKPLFLHKSLEWSYESEVRAAFYLRALAKIDLPHGRTGFALPVRANAIIGIKLGARCSVELEANIRAALRSHEIECRLERAVLDPHEYRVVFRDV